MSAATAAARREKLHRRGVSLEVFTVAWNAVEGVVAIGAGIATGSVSLIGFGADSFIEVISAIALLWRLRRAGPEASATQTVKNMNTLFISLTSISPSNRSS